MLSKSKAGSYKQWLYQAWPLEFRLKNWVIHPGAILSVITDKAIAANKPDWAVSCSSPKSTVQDRWKINKQDRGECAFKGSYSMSAFAGQGKLEAFGTKVGSYCQYLLTVYQTGLGPFLIARKIIRASLPHQGIRDCTCKRSYADLSCLSPPAPEGLEP